MENINLKWRDGFRKVWFYCFWLFTYHENWWVGPPDLHLCLHNTVAKSILMIECSLFIQREHSIINHAMFSFVDFWALIDMYHAWLGVKKCCFRVQVSPCLRVVLFHYTFGFLLSWTANCFSAETWIEFSDKPFIGDCKVHVVWRGLPFSPNFGLFWKKCAKN